MYIFMSSVTNDSFASSFQILMAFITFSCVMCVVTTGNTMNRGGESRHPCVVPDLSGKTFSFCPLSIILAVGLLYVAFIILRNAPSSHTLLSVFITNRGYTLSKAFNTSTDTIMCFLFPFVYVMVSVY